MSPSLTYQHPTSYTAYAILQDGGKLEKIEVPWKYPRAGEIVVKVLACGVCATDETCAKQIMPMSLPRIPGHEIVGDVVAVSCQERLWRVGQRVGAGWHGGHCSTCARCRAGDFVTCENHLITGANWDGGFAEYVTLRSEAVIAVPEDMDPAEAAPMLCAGVSTFQALRNIPFSPHDLVAIQGIGGLGHVALQFAHAMGLRTAALSTDKSKEATARTLGADVFVDTSVADPVRALLELGGAKAVISTAPDAAATAALLGGLAVEGTLLVLAANPEPMHISPLSLLLGRLSIKGWPAGTPKEAEECMAFAQAKGIKPIVQCFPLHKATEAFERCRVARLRAVIVP